MVRQRRDNVPEAQRRRFRSKIGDRQGKDQPRDCLKYGQRRFLKNQISYYDAGRELSIFSA